MRSRWLIRLVALLALAGCPPEDGEPAVISNLSCAPSTFSASQPPASVVCSLDFEDPEGDVDQVDWHVFGGRSGQQTLEGANNRQEGNARFSPDLGSPSAGTLRLLVSVMSLSDGVSSNELETSIVVTP